MSVMKFLKDKQTRHDFVTYAMCIVAFAIVFSFVISRSPVQVRPLAPETGENRKIFAGFLFYSVFQVANFPDPHSEMSRERRRG